MLEEGPRVARLRELVAQHAGSALRLSFGPRRKAGEFFDTMRLAGQWVQLAIPTTGYGAFIDAAVQTESRQILKGWILRLPQGGASGAPAPVTHHPSSASDIEESLLVLSTVLRLGRLLLLELLLSSTLAANRAGWVPVS